MHLIMCYNVSWNNVQLLLCNSLIIGIYPRASTEDMSYLLHTKLNTNQSQVLTHWGRGIHICFNDLTIIGSDNGQRQANIWTNVRMLSVEPLGTNFSEISMGIQENAFENVVWKMSDILSWPQYVKKISSICVCVLFFVIFLRV